MLLTANVGVALIENSSSSREAETAGLRAAAPPHIQQPSHLCHDGRVKVKVLYHVLFSPELKSSARCYLGLFVTVIQRGATLHFRGRRLCLLFGVYIHSADLRAKRAHQFPPSASRCSSSHALAFRRTWRVIVTLSHSLSSTERGGDRAGQTSGRARLLLPGLSPWRPLLPPLLRAPGWLPPLAVLLPRRASHLSHCHAVQLVDRTDAGQDLRSTAWDFNRHYRCKLSL